MKQKYKIHQRVVRRPSTNDSFVIMGIPATIYFLSSLRSSLQLLTVKNKIRTTTEKPKTF